LPDRARSLELLSRAARTAAARLRANEVLARASLLSTVALIYAALALTVLKVARGAPQVEHALAWGALGPAALFVAGVLHAALRQKPRTAGSLALDRHHGLHDRVTSALAFAEVEERERTALMQAAIDDAVAVARDLSPRKAAPIVLPRDFWAMALLSLAVLGIALVEVPVVRIVPPEAHHVDALTLGADDVDLLRRMSEELQATTTDPAALAGARRFNQVVEDLAERRLERREVFRRLDELEQSLKDPAGIDTTELDEALDGVAKELAKSALSKPVADALDEKKLADAEQAMLDLAKKVETAKKDVDRAKLEALRQSLKKASETVHEKSAKADASRKELEEKKKRLLQKKQEKNGLTQAEKEELNRAERQLERLNRDKNKSESGQQGLSGLDKDLAKAAQDLMKDLGQGAQDLQKGAEDIHRAAGQRMSEEQKKELKRKIEELRQILRQEGQAGRDRVKRMMQFGERAHGQNGQRGEGHGKGQGQGKEGQGGKGQQLRIGQGSPGPGGSLVLAPGAGAPIPGTESQGEGPGGGNGQTGSEWGQGHDPNLRGDSTKLKGQTEDVTAAAVDTGQGAASSQVIYGAAERGFVGRGYKKVYTDYQTVAEEALAKDEIPPGYRFYVRRYFQLIRPRD
jgi:hypothetical protein